MHPLQQQQFSNRGDGRRRPEYYSDYRNQPQSKQKKRKDPRNQVFVQAQQYPGQGQQFDPRQYPMQQQPYDRMDMYGGGSDWQQYSSRFSSQPGYPQAVNQTQQYPASGRGQFNPDFYPQRPPMSMQQYPQQPQQPEASKYYINMGAYPNDADQTYPQGRPSNSTKSPKQSPGTPRRSSNDEDSNTDLHLEKKSNWIPDSKAKSCSLCGKEFGLFQRRHHCRNCGFVFCQKCTVKTSCNTINGPQKGSSKDKRVRICVKCEHEVQTRNKLLKTQKHEERVKMDFENNFSSEEEEKDPFLPTTTDDGHDKAKREEDLSASQELQNKYFEQISKDEFFRKGSANRPLKGSHVINDTATDTMYNKSSFQDNSLTDRKGSIEGTSIKKLKELARYHIDRVVEDVMEENGIAKDIWGGFLHEFVLKAVTSVRPSSRYSNDTMDFNQYVDVQLVDYKDQSKSGYVNGCVFMKNLADKRMLKSIQDPKILLLKGSLGFMKDLDGGRTGQDVVTDINSIVNQDEHFVKILMDKIRVVNPDVIVTEKDISHKVLKEFQVLQIAAISNMEESKMKKLARLTNTIISPSANVLDKSFQIGRCAHFRVEEPWKKQGEGLINNKTWKPQSKSPTRNFESLTHYGQSQMKAELEKSSQMIYFEGCTPSRGSTILLSGPFKAGLESRVALEDGHEQLLRVKWSLKKMLIIARNIILEREFLLHMRVDVQLPLSFLQSRESENKYTKIYELERFSPFLVTRNIKNRSILVLYKLMIEQKLSHPAQGKSAAAKKIKNKVDTSIANESVDKQSSNSQERKVRSRNRENIFSQATRDRKSSHKSPKQQALSPTIPRKKPIDMTRDNMDTKQRDEKQTKVDEDFINKKLHSLCSKPRKVKFQFYNINLGNYDLKLQDQASRAVHPLDSHRYDSDETFGNFLVRAALQSEKNREQYLDQLKQTEEDEKGHKGPQAKRELHNLHCREKTCKHQLQSHVTSFYHKDGFLDIQVASHSKRHKILQTIDLDASADRLATHQSLASIRLDTNASLMNQSRYTASNMQLATMQMKQTVRKWDKIYTTAACSKCGFSPEKKELSDTLFEYSLSRFIEQFFYNGRLKPNKGGSGCGHCPLRDYIRWFHMADGSVVKFSFREENVYSVDLLNIREQNNNLEEVIKVCQEEKARISDIIVQKREALISDFDVLIGHKQEIERILRPNPSEVQPSNLAEIRSDEVVRQLSGCLDIYAKQILKMKIQFINLTQRADDTLKQFMKSLGDQRDEQSHSSHFTPQDIQKFYFLERKFLVNNLSFQAAVKQFEKVLCVIHVMLEHRVKMLRLPQEQVIGPTPSVPLLKQFQSLFPHLRKVQNQSFIFLKKAGASAEKKVLDMEEQLIAEAQAYYSNTDSPQLNQDPVLNYYILKCKPPTVSRAQMLNFLKTFFGSNEGLDSLSVPKEQADLEACLTESELAILYYFGYRLLSEAAKEKIRVQMVKADTKGSPALFEDILERADQHGRPQNGSSAGETSERVNSIFLPTGSDNGLIQVNADDTGSIIAYALNSNFYKEALIKNNYLEFQQRSTELRQQQQEGQFGASPHYKQHKSLLNLVHKDDIFNFEFAPQLIETELLCGEQQRLSFEIKFSNYSEDASLQVEKLMNNKVSSATHNENQMIFSTVKKRKNRAEQSPLMKAPKQDPFMDLNLNSQILKEYPLSLLELPSKCKLERTEVKDESQKEDISTIVFDSIIILENQIYTKLFNLFFENSKHSHTTILSAKNQMLQALQQREQAQSQSNQPEAPKIQVISSYGGAVALQPKKEPATPQRGSKSRQIEPTHNPSNQNLILNNQTLFGVRKPVAIFFDSDYKQRLLTDEMLHALVQQQTNSALQQQQHPPKSAKKTETSTKKSLAGSSSHQKEQMFLTPNNAGKKPLSLEPPLPLDEDRFLSQPKSGGSLGIHPPVTPVAGGTRATVDRGLSVPSPSPKPSSVNFERIDYAVKIFYPKKFEVLRKFYCGSHLNFIQSMMKSDSWAAKGGKTMSPFLKTFDQKYVMKEIKRPELKYFLEFGPQYFDYLCKSFFHDYPCTLAKIVGVFKITITKKIEKLNRSSNPAEGARFTSATLQYPTDTANSQRHPFELSSAFIDPEDEGEYFSKIGTSGAQEKGEIKIKKYVFVTENLNYGLTEEDEKNIIRYDLKGSRMKRFVVEKPPKELGISQQTHLKDHSKIDTRGRALEVDSKSERDKGDSTSRDGQSSGHPHLIRVVGDTTMSPTMNNEEDESSEGDQVPMARTVVFHDNNFIFDMQSRPLPMRYNMNKILNICVNNDTLCLSKSQIVDYSLLVIINKKTKKLRFGIIDYVQQFNFERQIESGVKKLLRGHEPTIVEQERYKKRFKSAVRRYFIGMCVQNEK